MRSTALLLRIAGFCLAANTLPALAEPNRSAERLAATCIPCHAPAGAQADARAAGTAKPKREWNEDFIRQRLFDYRNGRRAATVMDQIVAGYTPEELEAIARQLGAAAGKVR